MLGDLLHTLTPKDLQMTQLQVVAERRLVNGAALEHIISWTIPQGFTFLWKHVLVDSQGGGGQNVTDCIVTISPIVGGTAQGRHIVTGSGSSFVNDYGSATRYGRNVSMQDIPVHHESAIVIRSTYSAAVAVNSLLAVVHGILIPEGNIALGSLIPA